MSFSRKDWNIKGVYMQQLKLRIDAIKHQLSRAIGNSDESIKRINQSKKLLSNLEYEYEAINRIKSK